MLPASLLDGLPLWLRGETREESLFDDDDEDGDVDGGHFFGGWMPCYLLGITAIDALGLAVLLKTGSLQCDVPLRIFGVGGLLLGFPTSALIHALTQRKPAFRHYRLCVNEVRSSGNPYFFQLDDLRLFGRQCRRYSDRAIEGGRTSYGWWTASFRKPVLVESYQLVTSQSAAQHDPISWCFEASNDCVKWTRLDYCHGITMPTARRAKTAIIGNLQHLSDGGPFRKAFLAELAANAAAFAWLVAGTSWITAGSETCIDSAPLLWYTSFVTVVCAWSVLGTITIGLLISGLAIVLLKLRNAG
eukprot:NODE_10981_length_1316_cov_8.540791.p1 GENE.NODE_10981_length_1316_cov_8.540791~~NODE_10981_length_1316_cov_8.540791.p1  ORF type:complete len:332 (-),score=87.49 NODE_10981_length_1316_cov_8.540791:320-1225(-)